MFTTIEKIDKRIAELKLREKAITRLLASEEIEIERLLQIRRFVLANRTDNHTKTEDIYINELKTDIAISESYVNDLRYRLDLNRLYIEEQLATRLYLIDGKDELAKLYRKNSLKRIKKELKEVDREFTFKHDDYQIIIRKQIRNEVRTSGVNKVLRRSI